MTLQKEFEKFKPKKKLLVDVQNEIRDIFCKKRKYEQDILQIYNIVFNNFTSKRIITTIKNKDNDNTSLILNKEGLGYLNKYYSNSDYIKEFNKLKEAFKEYKEILKFVTKSNKKKIVKIFGQEFNKLSFGEKLIFDLNINPKCSFDDEKEQKDFIIYDGVRFIIEKKGEDYWKRIILDLDKKSLDNWGNIEIFYKDILKCLNEFKKLLIKSTKEKQKMRDNLKQIFSSELILSKLKIEKS